MINRAFRSSASLLLAALVLGGVATEVQAAQTIVGRWRLPSSACLPSAGAMSIEPMRIVWDEGVCNFRDVSRNGNVVTWHGVCADPEPRSSERVTVVAEGRGEHLYMRVNGGRESHYVRCR